MDQVKTLTELEDTVKGAIAIALYEKTSCTKGGATLYSDYITDAAEMILWNLAIDLKVDLEDNEITPENDEEDRYNNIQRLL